MPEKGKIPVEPIDEQLFSDLISLLVENFAGTKLMLRTMSQIKANLEKKDEDEIFQSLMAQWNKESELLRPEFIGRFLKGEGDEQ